MSGRRCSNIVCLHVRSSPNTSRFKGSSRCSPDRFRNRCSVPLYHQSSRSRGTSTLYGLLGMGAGRFWKEAERPSSDPINSSEERDHCLEPDPQTSVGLGLRPQLTKVAREKERRSWSAQAAIVFPQALTFPGWTRASRLPSRHTRGPPPHTPHTHKVDCQHIASFGCGIDYTCKARLADRGL